MYFWNAERTKAFLKRMVSLCRTLNINCVAGPVMSGAAMATATVTYAMVDGYSMSALLLGKAGGGTYLPAQHSAGIRKIYYDYQPINRIILVDDIVHSGSAMLHAFYEVRASYPNASIVAAVSGTHWRAEPARMLVRENKRIKLFMLNGIHSQEFKLKEKKHVPLDP